MEVVRDEWVLVSRVMMKGLVWVCCSLGLFGCDTKHEEEVIGSRWHRHEPTVTITHHGLDGMTWGDFLPVLRALAEAGHANIEVGAAEFRLPCMCPEWSPPAAKDGCKGQSHLVDPRNDEYPDSFQKWAQSHAGNPLLVAIGCEVDLEQVVAVVHTLNRYDFFTAFVDSPPALDPGMIRLVIDAPLASVVPDQP